MDPADLYRVDSLPQLDSSPPPQSLNSKTLPPLSTGGANGQKAVKPSNAIPRIDTETIYTQLKAAIGDHWGEYKAALASFLSGQFPSSNDRTR